MSPFDKLKETVRLKATGDRGFVLILALVTMLAMTLIGLSVVMNMTTDLALSRNEREAKTAFQLSEAGIREGVSRLHLASSNARYVGEKSTDANYRQITWNDANSLGRNFSSSTNIMGALSSTQSYSVSIEYLDETNSEGFCDSNEASPNDSVNSSSPPASCDDLPVEVVMYGRDFNIDLTVTKISRGKLPVYRLVSTGASGGTTRVIEAYIGASSLNTDTEAGVNTNSCVNFAGGAFSVTGGMKEGGAGPCTTCNDGVAGCAAKASDDMVTYLGEDLSEVIDMADETHRCKGPTCNAPGDDIPSSGSIDTVVVDWGDAAGDTYSTLIYIDNSGGNDVTLSGNFTGRGILIVSGDLKLSGNLVYEGLVYVLGTLTISGGGSALNVTGGVMANDTVSINGNVTVNYNQETLLDVAKQNSTSEMIVWKRM